MHHVAHLPVIVAASVAAYVALCTYQIYTIQSSVGLSVSLTNVFKYTIKLIFTAGPWLPFLMNPPAPPS